MHETIELAKRHIGFDENIADRVLEIELNSKSTKDAKKLHNWARQVGCSIQRAEMFTRLSINENGILFARIDPEHYVEDIVVNFFANRFPMYVIVLESRRGCFVKKKNQQLAIVNDRMENVIYRLEKNLDTNDILCDLLDFDDKMIWKVFYNSASIMQRKNKRYFMRNIPKKYHELPGLEEEKIAFDGNQSLLAYD